MVRRLNMSFARSGLWVSWESRFQSLLDPLDAPAIGNLLICCSRPRGDIVIDLKPQPTLTKITQACPSNTPTDSLRRPVCGSPVPSTP
jgi:hypothetical protein